MAIIRRSRKSGNKYQMKIRGTDGRWFSETFDTLTAAREREAKLVGEKFRGATLENYANKQMSLSEFFDH